MYRADELTMMFEAIDDDSRRYVLAVLRGEYERAIRSSRPRLRLIDCCQAISDLAKNQVNPFPVGRTG
ncbi:hypothetical protein SAMN05428966_10279 [Massilia sp. PDC64]|nr:hypothetical protein [Massilia sp. PDC64]SDC67017.1 hypothetical protein SAMN05428966_10279 [Massilia sp. PDC64]